MVKMAKGQNQENKIHIILPTVNLFFKYSIIFTGTPYFGTCLRIWILEKQHLPLREGSEVEF